MRERARASRVGALPTVTPVGRSQTLPRGIGATNSNFHRLARATSTSGRSSNQASTSPPKRAVSRWRAPSSGGQRRTHGPTVPQKYLPPDTTLVREACDPFGRLECRFRSKATSWKTMGSPLYLPVTSDHESTPLRPKMSLPSRNDIVAPSRLRPRRSSSGRRSLGSPIRGQFTWGGDVARRTSSAMPKWPRRWHSSCS